MRPGSRKAWVTVAVDETSVKNAIVLAKSLSRVATVADVVVLTSYDIFHSRDRKQLVQYFDVVLPQKFSDSDQLKLVACHLQMYSTCVILSPNKMVTKNSDELFDMDKNFAAVLIQDHENAFDTSVFVIKPRFYLQHCLSERMDDNGVSSLSETFNNFFARGENHSYVHQLSMDYNYNISKSLPNVDGIHTAKIVDFGDTIELLKNRIQMNPLVKEKIDSWISFYETVINNFNIGSPTSEQHNLPSSIDFSGQSYYKNSIAIVGYSCRFPAANSTEEFWDLLKRGGDGIIKIPSERLSDFQKNDTRYTESLGGFLKCPIDEFDANFFGISPREATFMDPQQRLLLEVAWESLENAAINPQSLKGGSTGVFTGVWQHDYERLVTETASAQDFHRVILGNAFSATSARVSYFLGLNGPNIAIESGCSSSMIGIHLACESLRKEETNLCLVFGANILALNLPLSAIPIFAKDGHCKTFDEKADGFARAEGIAGVVLKRLPDALKNGDRVLGIIRGSGVTNEGTSCSFGTPSKHCQEVAVREALKNADVSPTDVDFVEAHGTGTPVGDPIEFAALSAAYAAGDREKPLFIGAVKTNTGHTESAAGLAGLFKVLLSLKHEKIPPNINFTSVNPNINLDTIPAKLPIVCENWNRNPCRKRIAGISSFGISGGNVHVIVEEPPLNTVMGIKTPNSSEFDQSHHIFTISAKSENALVDLSKKYIDYFQCNPDVNLADVAFTANNGRANFKFRSAFVTSDIKELTSTLESHTYEPPSLQSEKPKIAFLFTGQGSQYFGMGKDLYKSNVVFRNAFDKCNLHLQKTVGISLSGAIWEESKESLLEQSVYRQLSILAVEYSLLKLWESFGIKPEFVLGHSIGEYAAAVASGILDINDALDLLVERSKLIDTLPEGGMLAVKASKDIVSELILEFSKLNSDLYIDIAGVNSPFQTVVAGSNDAINEFEIFSSKSGKKSQKLLTNRGFHSRAMDPILNQFQAFSIKFSLKHSNCIYISGKTGECLEMGEMDSSYWTQHMRDTVNFEKGMTTLLQNGCNVFVEIGSHPVLLALGMSNMSYTNESIWLPSLRRKESCWKTILESLGKLYVNGGQVDWKALDLLSVRQKLELPTYPFQRRKYWTECNLADNLALKLHPYLGKKVSLADQNVHIYENEVNLKEFDYLKDHQVANIIIFPAAMYLEIALACSRDVFKETSPNGLTVLNFSVEAPLELEPGKQYKMQTMIFPEDDDGKIKLQIFVYQNVNGYADEKSWKLYSTAVLAPVSNSSILEINDQDTITDNNIEDIKQRFESLSAADMYKDAANVGFIFGERFQTIKRIWRGKDEYLVEIPIPPKDNGVDENYVYHPLVLDAMLQLVGLIFGWNEGNKSLCLPVAIEKFRAIKNCAISSNFYVHAIVNHQSNGKSSRLLLYNENNILLAAMEGVRLVRTSINSFLNIINTLRNKLPGMYQEVWRSRDAPLNSRLDLSGHFNISKDVFSNEIDKILMVEKEKCKIFKPLVDNKHCTAPILKFLYDMDWNAKVDEHIDCRSLIISRGWSLSVEGIIRRFFNILCEDGYLNKGDTKTEWIVAKNLPTLEEVNEDIQNYNTLWAEIDAVANKSHAITRIEKHCMDQLPELCLGKSNPNSILFGNDDPNLNALKVYTDSFEVCYANKCMSLYLQLVFKELGLQGANKGPVLRIVEIGAGSGATTKEIITGLKKCGIPFRYTFSDISFHFINEAKIKFADENNIEYKILDIEKDPLVQGFAPYHYDIVVASNVIHATERLRDSMRNVRLLLRNNGLLLLQEMLESKRHIDMIFGILEGYWRFTDYDIRPDHPCVGKDIWDHVLSETGFETSQNILDVDDEAGVLVTRVANSFDMEKLLSDSCSRKSWVLYCDTDGVYKHLEKMLKSVGREVYLIKGIDDYKNDEPVLNSFYINTTEYGEVEDCLNEIFKNSDVEGFCYLRSLSDYSRDDQRSICLPGLNTLKYLMSHNRSKTRFCAATTGVYYTRNQKNLSPHKSTLVGMFKTASSEFASLSVKIIDLDADCPDINVYAAELFYELFSGEDFICSFRNNNKSVMRICQMAKGDAPLTLPKGRYTAARPASKKIEDFLFKSAVKSPLGPQDVEVLVKSAAINFRDLFVILQPEQFRSKYESIGSDFSGIVSDIGAQVTRHRIGDKVFGVATNSCVASHVIVDQKSVVAIPPNLTYSEASTIPSVFLTAYLCMVDIANLKEGETILIHVASGGVGLISIEIAKLLRARIIATAGSHRKRAYLKSMGIEHVFHSRDFTYEDGINKATGGKGVDMVLNSLTGPGFKEATLRACGVGARFVEIGKLNIWKPEEIKEIRPDVKYTIFDLEKIELGVTESVGKMEKFCSKLERCPIPYLQFPVTQFRDAMKYFAKAEHIGKIVLTLPEIRERNDQHLHPFNFEDCATYLITGGLTGIGLEVAKWMVDCGAKNIVLVARSLPKENALKTIEKLRSKGCRVQDYQLDIGNWEQCSKLFETIQSPKNKWPSLKGIIHSAAVLADDTLLNQTWEKFESVFQSKVSGGWNLHNLSKNLLLDHFVVFSSIANLIGSVGQSNYSAAGMFLDSLVHYRHSIGLPAQTINWGAWATVGKSSNIDGFNEGRLGITFFSPSQGIAALEYIMSQPNLKQVAVAQIDPSGLIDAFGSKGNYFSELIVEEEDENSINQAIATSEAFWAEINALDLPGRVTYIKKYLEKVIKKTLKLPDSDHLDEFQNFSDMGLDSLMGVEIKNKLQNIVGKKLIVNATSLLDYPTLSGLSQHLAEQTLNVSEISLQQTEVHNDKDLIKLDSILPEDIQCTKKYIVRHSEIRNILFTGSTGRFGVYLLKDLLKKHNLQIHCLIRGKSVEQARKKLLAALKKFHLQKDIDIDRISIVLGNIAEDLLGLTPEQYNSLSAKIDSIIHLAVRANHVEKYVKSKSGITDIRSVNVLGTVNILRFSSNIRTKRVFYSSSYSAINSLTEDGFACEDFPDEDNEGDNISWGYILSKFICEKLMKQANERGIPCTVVRYLSLTGDSQTGFFSIDSNSFLNFIFMCVRNGVITEIDGGWCFMPVDIASALTIKLLFNDDAESGVYNFTPPFPLYVQDFVDMLSELGHPLRVVTPDELEMALKSDTANNAWISIFTDSYGSDLKSALINASAVGTILKDKKRVYQISDKLLKAVPNFQNFLPDEKMVLSTYLKFAISSGILKNINNVQ